MPGGHSLGGRVASSLAAYSAGRMISGVHRKMEFTPGVTAAEGFHGANHRATGGFREVAVKYLLGIH